MSPMITMQEKKVVSWDNTWYGFSGPGNATSDPCWQIYKEVTTAWVTTKYLPIGLNRRPSTKAEFAWDDYADLNYSLTPDYTAPTLTTVTIASNNADTTLAKPGDIVTITVVASERVTATATIGGNDATFVAGVDDKHFTFTYTMTEGDTEGTIAFTIDFYDVGWISGTQVTAVTSWSSVTYDETAPTLDSAVRDSDTQITVTLSELAIAASITKANAGGFTVADTTTPATTYAVSGIAPGATDDEVVLTVADISGSIAEGVTVTYTAGGNGTVEDLAGNDMVTDATGVLIPTWA